MDSESSLEVLNPKYNEYRSLNENLGQRVLFLDVKAILLAATYLIVLINLYAQITNPLSTGNSRFWIPACLFASVVVVFWPAFIYAVNDCLRSRQQQESTFMEQEKVYRKIYSIRTGRRRDADAAEQSLAKALAFVRRQRYACVGAMHFALIVFTLIVSYALLSYANKFGGDNGLPHIHFRIEVPPSAAIQFVSAR